MRNGDMTTKLTIGYARASTDDQSTEVQAEQLKAAGCSTVLAENGSGTKLDGREMLETALKLLDGHPGSLLVVARLDRLARNTKDALAILDRIHTAKCGLKVLDMDVNTATTHGKMLFSILSALATWETEMRRERQRLGIEKAKAKGVYEGRKPKLTEVQVADLKQRHAAEVSLSTLAREFKISKATVCRYLLSKPDQKPNRVDRVPASASLRSRQ
jgi:DNA invertase Pin-like site-specific DNA recombinase